jgi:hypothetical protein
MDVNEILVMQKPKERFYVIGPLLSLVCTVAGQWPTAGAIADINFQFPAGNPDVIIKRIWLWARNQSTVSKQIPLCNVVFGPLNDVLSDPSGMRLRFGMFGDRPVECHIRTRLYPDNTTFCVVQPIDATCLVNDTAQIVVTLECEWDDKK